MGHESAWIQRVGRCTIRRYMDISWDFSDGLMHVVSTFALAVSSRYITPWTSKGQKVGGTDMAYLVSQNTLTASCQLSS